MTVNQSGFNQYFIFTETVQWESVVFVTGDAVEYIGFILDFNGFKDRLTQVVADSVTTMAHVLPPFALASII
jgi:hypothetical protein